jgi:hypothetical protein
MNPLNPHLINIGPLKTHSSQNMSKKHIELAEKLASLNLDELYEVLTSNGFKSWEAVQRITETDMERLELKRGYRRKILRAIATDQGYPTSYRLIDSNTSKG